MVFSDYLALVIVLLSQIVGHRLPWSIIPALVDSDGMLRRPFAYAYGCLGIFAGMALYACAHPQAWPAVIFAALAISAAGLGTMIPRGVEALGETRHLQQDRADLEALLDGQTDR